MGRGTQFNVKHTLCLTHPLSPSQALTFQRGHILT